MEPQMTSSTPDDNQGPMQVMDWKISKMLDLSRPPPLPMDFLIITVEPHTGGRSSLHYPCLLPEHPNKGKPTNIRGN